MYFVVIYGAEKKPSQEGEGGGEGEVGLI